MTNISNKFDQGEVTIIMVPVVFADSIEQSSLFNTDRLSSLWVACAICAQLRPQWMITNIVRIAY